MNNIFEKSLEYVKENIVNLFLYVVVFLAINAPINYLSDAISGVMIMGNQNIQINNFSFLGIVLSFVTSVIAVLFSAEVYLAIKEDRNLRYFGWFSILKEQGFEIIKLVFLVNVKTFLWSLLLIVPGIIKGIEYQRVIYLKVNNKELTSKECFEIAKEEMKGFKAQFFGLNILVAILIIISFVVMASLVYFALSPLFVFLAVIISWIIILISAMIIFSIQGNFNVEMDKYYEK